MGSYYVGITIGPIIETLELASRPASLWCASAMFSWLSEDICNRALNIGGKIISPYYPKPQNPDYYSVIKDGIGKYHDRVIFAIDDKDDELLEAKIKTIINESKKALADALVSDKLSETIKIAKSKLVDVVKNYLQVRFIIEKKTDDYENVSNCILRLSPYLDAAELCPTFTIDQSLQPIATLFEGKSDEHHNQFVKNVFGMENGNTSLLDSNGRVRDIESIAMSDNTSDRKIFKYYAIVQADGDNIGKLLSALHTDEEVRKFSKQCLEYTSKAAEMINEYGGMTIYAGGDDLLFICPLENSEYTNVFSLCQEICKSFSEKFGEDDPTLSFGISINYKSFPLYEAFSDTLNMLFGVAKKTKNSTAIHIRKNSGQSIKFCYPNNGTIYKELHKFLNPQNGADKFHAILYNLGLYRPIITAALASGRNMKDTFDNLFDSGFHAQAEEYITDIKDALVNIYMVVKSKTCKDYGIEKLFESTSSSDEEIAVDLLYSILRVAKFFSEKKGDE